MSDDFTILAADDQVIYNSNHIYWIDFWLSDTPMSIRELVQQVHALNKEDELYIQKCIIIAIYIVKKIAFLTAYQTETERSMTAMEVLPFLVYTKQFVSGSLFTFISHIQFKHGIVEPKQAPKGWTCALCLESKDSHFTLKTECGHYFHYKCCVHLTNSACPLCRQIMNI